MSGHQDSKGKLHYAWIVASVTFVVLLATAGIRATPGILIVPLENEFGWTRATISGAIAVNIALFGIIGPFAASLMSRYGLRRIVLLAVALLAFAVAASSFIRSPWQLFVCWGLLVGIGTGITSLVLAAIVVRATARAGAGHPVGCKCYWPACIPSSARHACHPSRLA